MDSENYQNKLINELDNILFVDGSLRDILINDINKSDWNIFFKTIPKFKTACFISSMDNEIDKNVFKDKLIKRWKQKKETINFYIHIYLDEQAYICSYFNDISCIEQDFDPNLFNTKATKILLIDYLLTLSNALRKKIFITEEMNSEYVLMTIIPKRLSHPIIPKIKNNINLL